VYVVRVGGDMLYFRLLAFPTCLGLLATGGVLEHAVARLPSTWPRRVIAGALGLGVAVWFFARYPEQLAGHPIDLEVDTRQWRKIADPMWHRQHHQLSPSPKRAAADRKLLDDYAQAPPSVRAHEEVLVHPWCRRALFSFDKYVVHSYGLTDAVLSRVQVPAARPGHKPLQRYAKDLARIRRRHDLRRAPGTFRAAVEAGHAPRWVRENLAALELLERKMYNRHDFGENLELALTPVPPIAVR
jgi:hypothetical protein